MPDAPAAVRHDPPGRARRVAAVWRRHATVYGRSFWSNATPAVLEPMFLLASVGLGVGAHVEAKFNGLAFAAYMAPGIVASASLWTAAFESTYGTWIRLRYQATYDMILATPATIGDVVVAELLWAASKGVLYSAVVAAVLAAMGYVGSPAALAIPAFGFVTALAAAGMGLFVTSRLKSIDHLQVYFTVVLTPMVFFSGMLFPVAQLPGPLAVLAQVLPMYHAVETVRLLAHGPAHVSASWSWACPFALTAWALALAWIGGASFHRRMLSER
jgi:lipooligosaccharide transport system permease protein